MFGHRGASDNYPENTILAFSKAVEEGVGGIEMDIRRTKDGTYMVMHDPTLDRTTNGTGAIAEQEWEYISGLDAGAWKATEFAGREDTKVPSLEQVLYEFKYQPVFLSLQLKMEIQDIYPVIDLVRSEDLMKRCLFFANRSKLAQIREYEPKCFVMNDGRVSHSNYGDMLSQAVEQGWNAISWHWKYITQEMVRDFHANNLICQASYLSSSYNKNMKKLIDLDVDFILGNDCAAMSEVIDDYTKFF